MKKYLILLLMLISISSFAEYKELEMLKNSSETASSAVSTIYNDGKALVQTVYDDSKSLVENVYPEIKQAITAIANSIGVAAERVYIILVKKYLVEGICELLIFLMASFFLIFGIINLNKFIKNNINITWKIIPSILFTITGVLILTIGVDYYNMLMGLINPEFGAINYIIEYSKTFIK